MSKLLVHRMSAPGVNHINIAIPIAPQIGVIEKSDGASMAVLVYTDPAEALADAARFVEMALAGVKAEARVR